jgi:hypothetical protein
MNILCLGTLTSIETHNAIIAFKKVGYNVIMLNISRHYFPNYIEEIPNYDNIVNLYQGIDINKNKIISKIERLLVVCGLYSGRSQVVKRISNIFKKNHIDIVYSLWGTDTFPEIKIIQNQKIYCPIIHNFLTFPGAPVSRFTRLKYLFYKEIVSNIEGRIHCSNRMYNYINKLFNLKQKGKDIIFLDYFSEMYFPLRRLPLLSEENGEPHILFIGRTDFQKGSLNDVKKIIKEIALKQIHIHLAETDISIDNNEYLHFFPRFKAGDLSKGSFAEFMTQFDACIILYNFNIKNWPKDRFYNSLPNRFLFAFTGGIPIIMPEGYFLSCQEIIKKYQIGFTYKDVEDLRSKIKNKHLMEKIKENAIKISSDFTFEKNFHKLEKFMKNLNQ